MMHRYRVNECLFVQRYLDVSDFRFSLDIFVSELQDVEFFPKNTVFSPQHRSTDKTASKLVVLMKFEHREKSNR